jgi:hypothetical protein
MPYEPLDGLQALEQALAIIVYERAVADFAPRPGALAVVVEMCAWNCEHGFDGRKLA